MASGMPRERTREKKDRVASSNREAVKFEYKDPLECVPIATDCFRPTQLLEEWTQDPAPLPPPLPNIEEARKPTTSLTAACRTHLCLQMDAKAKAAAEKSQAAIMKAA